MLCLAPFEPLFRKAMSKVEVGYPLSTEDEAVSSSAERFGVSTADEAVSEQAGENHDGKMVAPSLLTQPMVWNHGTK